MTTAKGRASKSYQPKPASMANLIPFKPGEQHNPAPGNSLKAALLTAMRQPLVKPPADAPAQAHVVYATLKGAIDCEPGSEHLRTIWERLEGKVAQPVTGAGGGPLVQINVMVASVLGEALTKRIMAGEGTQAQALGNPVGPAQGPVVEGEAKEVGGEEDTGS